MVTKEEKYNRKRYWKDFSDVWPEKPKTLGVGTRYRIAHGCFDCRKSFKIEVDNFNRKEFDHKCPQCGEVLTYLGRTFRAPKQADKKQWLKVQKLVEAGFVFAGCGDSLQESYPKTLNEVEEFIARNPNHRLRIGK